MELLDDLLLRLHVIAGFCSLILFMVPMILKKGSEWHKKTGKMYVIGMWIVVLSAFFLSIINLIQGRQTLAVFLGFLSLITANALWYGVAVLKQDRDISISFAKKIRLFEMIIFILALMIIAWVCILPWSPQSVLLLIFGGLGLTAGKRAFTTLPKLKSELDRMGDHIQGLLSSAIAAFTAFLVFGGSNLINGIYDSQLYILFWVLPGVIGGFAIAWYRKKNSPKASAKKIVA